MPGAKGLRGRVRRVGHSIAIFVPPKDARRGRLKPGADITLDVHDAPDESTLGFLKRRGVHHREIADRKAETEMWPDDG